MINIVMFFLDYLKILSDLSLQVFPFDPETQERRLVRQFRALLSAPVRQLDPRNPKKYFQFFVFEGFWRFIFQCSC